MAGSPLVGAPGSRFRAINVYETRSKVDFPAKDNPQMIIHLLIFIDVTTGPIGATRGPYAVRVTCIPRPPLPRALDWAGRSTCNLQR